MKTGIGTNNNLQLAMHNIYLKKLTAAMMVSAGILAIDSNSLYAQDKAKERTAMSKPNESKMGKGSAGAMFVKKAAESNLAEIELSKLALQKASSQQVKDYAQQMVDHHTMAQEELAAIVSGSASMGAGQSGNDASMDDSNTSGAGNVSGGTTGTGSTYSSGNAAGAVGTQDKVSGQTPNTTGQRQGNSSNSNDPGNSTGNNSAGSNATGNNSTGNNATGTTGGNNAGLGTGSDYKSSSTGGGGAGANAGGTTSSGNAGIGSDPRTTGTTESSASEQTSAATNSPANTNNAQNNTSDSNANSNTDAIDNAAIPAGNTGITANTHGNAKDTRAMAMYGDLPTQLSAEHQMVHDKLSKLSGTEFDRQYVQAMVKDHAKAVELFEKQSKSTDDAPLKGYATKNLPLIKQHHQMAQKLSGGKSNSGKSTSGKGTSDSK